MAEWLLMLGAEVRGFSLKPPTSPSLFDQLGLAGRIVWDEGDLRDPQAVVDSIQAARPDFVFHLAAQPLVRLSYQQPVETWQTNVMGTINVLEALKQLSRGGVEELSGEPVAPPSSQPFTPSTPQPAPGKGAVAVLITTDKCYENREWLHGYREEDALGGYDPYSSSKAACEIAIASWRRAFFKASATRIFSARAGNVIGGGDWALDRIVPDAIRALEKNEAIPVRNKVATRPWQHVLEPLGGYLLLAAKASRGELDECLSAPGASAAAFNFGPDLASNRTVAELVTEVLRHWPGDWQDRSDPNAPHEAGKLNLTTDKAFHLLGWRPQWDFETTIRKTLEWYRAASTGGNVVEITQRQIADYSAISSETPR